MSDTPQIVNITDIDLTDTRYRVSLTPKGTRALAASIKSAGLLSPPLLRKIDGRYIVISGRSRIKALALNEVSKVPAMVVTDQTSELACCLKAISSEAFQRPLGPAEVISGIKLLLHHTNTADIAAGSIQTFHSNLSEPFVRDMNKISNLPDPALELIHNGMISIKTARRLTEFSDTVQNLFLNLFSKIKASSNKQLEIITHLFEIAARDKIQIENLFCEPAIMSLLSDGETPPGVKADRLRAHLQEKRFPTLSETRARIQGMIEKLKLGPGIKLLAPDNFESPDYTLSFTARNPEQFETRLKKIQSAVHQDGFKHIFTP